MAEVMLRALLLPALAVAAMSGAAAAHPHVSVSADLRALTGTAAVELAWSCDDSISLPMIESLGLDADGLAEKVVISCAG